MKHKKWILICLILLLGFAVRVYKISSSPEGISIDEASMGYTAWSIVSTGKDPQGTYFPIFYNAFGEYKVPVIYVYSIALAQLFFGPTAYSIRIPAVGFGLGTAFVLYFLTKLFLADFFEKRLVEKGGLLALLLAVLSPWSIQFTRAGFDASAALFFTCLGVFLFFKARSNSSLKLLLGSFLSFAASLYSYNNAKIVVPLLILCLVLLNFKRLKIKHLIFSSLVFIVVMLPFVVVAITPEGLLRARDVVVFYDPNLKNPWLVVLKAYWENISPYYLFYSGDPALAHGTPHKMSVLHVVEWPFVLMGMIYLAVKIRKSGLIFLWFLIAPIPAAISILNPHAIRGILTLPPLIIFSTVGFLVYLKVLKVINFQRIALIFYVFMLTFLCFRFLNIYHTKYVIDSGWDWLYDVKKVSDRVRVIEENYDQIYFEEGGRRTIAYLWDLKYPPRKYLESSKHADIEKYHFGYSFDQLPGVGRNIYITRQSALPFEKIEIIFYQNQKPAFYIYNLEN